MDVLDVRRFRYNIENGALHVGWYTEMPPLGNIEIIRNTLYMVTLFDLDVCRIN
jgi:hypothetical protein